MAIAVALTNTGRVPTLNAKLTLVNAVNKRILARARYLRRCRRRVHRRQDDAGGTSGRETGR
ncbi:hypothetical protein [Stakelama saccharophila]|uniref:Uncharacterized protein n=1 Tax=Stakelama saccharophila TaxID=3075605 RepID=A0ABZ0BAJ2_9SPHN|nr:hypothetical protein [Stakelama sp. W311]WNO54304.1 hypothetical protein RPR59_03345 [Stakelama sp. W311]